MSSRICFATAPAAVVIERLVLGRWVFEGGLLGQEAGFEATIIGLEGEFCVPKRVIKLRKLCYSSISHLQTTRNCHMD